MQRQQLGLLKPQGAKQTQTGKEPKKREPEGVENQGRKEPQGVENEDEKLPAEAWE